MSLQSWELIILAVLLILGLVVYNRAGQRP